MHKKTDQKHTKWCCKEYLPGELAARVGGDT
jgi:hypothetical protein